jgi:hypothetical protein
VAPPAFARQARPVSVGIGAASLGRTDDAIFGTRPAGGLASWVEVAIAPKLSLEGRVHWFPRDEAPDFGTRGGKTLVAMVGARGRFFTSRYVAVDGLLQTGVVHFTRAGLSWFGNEPETAPRSRLGFDMGLSAVLFPRSRWTARIDFGEVAGRCLKGPPVLPRPPMVPTVDGRVTATVEDAVAQMKISGSAPIRPFSQGRA